MIKRVPTSELKLGMFIHDLNCGWLDHSFLRGSFLLRRESDLQQLQATGIGAVYIDPSKGLDCAGAPTREEVLTGLTARILETPLAWPAPPEGSVPYAEELAAARQTLAEADQAIGSGLEELRLGRPLRVERLDPPARRITAAVLRNPGALASLCRVRGSGAGSARDSVSVATLLVVFGRALGLDRDALHQLALGGLLHDLGMVRVPAGILGKPGKLTGAEFAGLKQHVVLGLEVLAGTPGVSRAVVEVAGEHHERLDGTGYPYGVQGEAISRAGRMAAIVDVYDALTGTGGYHDGMEPTEALTRLYEWSARHFDPVLVRQFIQAVGLHPAGSLVRLASQRLAVVTDQGRAGLLRPKVRVVYDLARGTRLAPVDLDLAGGADAIAGAAQPEGWNLAPFGYLFMEAS